MTTRPRAYRLEAGAEGVRAAESRIVVTEEPAEAIAAADGVPVIVERRRRSPWLGILVSALGGLLTLFIGLGVERLIADLFQAAPWLGWLAVALAAAALIAFGALCGREVAGLFRERRIELLRSQAFVAIEQRDHAAAKAVVANLLSLPAFSMGSGRREIEALSEEILDAQDRLAIAERVLVAPLDEAARRAVAQAAKQVSVVTALSPRAIVDVAFVVYSAMRLLRRIAAIYGGRPGVIGFLRLARAALNHLVITGGVAVGDSLVQQVLGLGLAARVSAKLGEGALNGLMTARFGLAALAVCRPLPYIRSRPPGIGDVAGELFGGASEERPARL